MRILHVSCSPRGNASESYRLSQKIISHLLQREPTAVVDTRVVSGSNMPHVDADYALSQHARSDVSDKGSAALSEKLVRELESSDVVVISTPMHNFTVPSGLKAWIDHVVRVRRTFNVSHNGKIGLLLDRPVLIAVSSGGIFSGVGARQPDFLTPYLKTVLAIVGLHKVSFFLVQGATSSPDALEVSRNQAEADVLNYFRRSDS